jgi:hypothetical protein
MHPPTHAHHTVTENKTYPQCRVSQVRIVHDEQVITALEATVYRFIGIDRERSVAELCEQCGLAKRERSATGCENPCWSNPRMHQYNTSTQSITNTHTKHSTNREAVAIGRYIDGPLPPRWDVFFQNEEATEDDGERKDQRSHGGSHIGGRSVR